MGSVSVAWASGSTVRAFQRIGAWGGEGGGWGERGERGERGEKVRGGRTSCGGADGVSVGDSLADADICWGVGLHVCMGWWPWISRERVYLVPVCIE